jgi:membrane protease YdiL (CAAX protease family)
LTAFAERQYNPALFKAGFSQSAACPARIQLVKSIFVGLHGIRAGWRFLLFVVLCQIFAKIADWTVTRPFGYKYHAGWGRTDFIIDGGLSFASAILAAWTLSRIERRPLRDYGLSIRTAFGRLFWEGTLWGFLASTATLGLIALSGGASMSGLALHGQALLSSALLWGLAMLLLALAEEFIYRGYSLFTLTTGMGFWPSAIALSILFGGIHYFLKPMESWLDGVSVGLFGLFWCLTLRRTGNLWFAIGFHAMSNFADLALYAQPNTGNLGLPLTGHLLKISYHGPSWLTGGACGSEASVMVIIVLAAMFWLFNRRFREIRFRLHGQRP